MPLSPGVYHLFNLGVKKYISNHSDKNSSEKTRIVVTSTSSDGHYWLTSDLVPNRTVAHKDNPNGSQKLVWTTSRKSTKCQWRIIEVEPSHGCNPRINPGPSYLIAHSSLELLATVRLHIDVCDCSGGGAFCGWCQGLGVVLCRDASSEDAHWIFEKVVD